MKAGKYVSEDHTQDITVLREVFGEAPGAEAEIILDALEKTIEIFVAYKEGRYADNNRIREQYMKDNLDLLLQAHARDGALPRVIFKMGGAHILEGVGPNGVVTLGDHAQKLAEANGLDALHIGIRRYSAETGEVIPETVFAEGHETVLIDMQPLRTALAAGALPEYPALTISDIRGFDALIYLREAPRASKATIRGYQAAFRQRLISSIAVAAIPVLIFASGLVPVLIFLWRQATKSSERANAHPLWPGLLTSALAFSSLGIFATQIKTILNSSASAPAALAGTICTPSPLSLVLLMALLTGGLIGFSWMRGWWSLAGRIYFLIYGAGVIFLALFMYHWNLGGMLAS